MRPFLLVQACVIVVSSLAFAQLGDERMQKANTAASTVVKERMRAERPADARWLEQVSASDIVVVRGEYDRVEDVLRPLGIKHTVVNPIQVAQLELNARQLLIVDCPGDIGPKGIEKIRKFVNAGGYLYTTDWALKGVVQKAFPGFVAHNGVETSNDVVEVQVGETSNNLLKHLTLSKENPKWWLESSSYPIKVLATDKVDVLVTSKEMKSRYGQAAIAVHFRYGDGQVLHIASHFFLQQNQTRTVVDKKGSKAYLKEDSSLSENTKQALEKKADFADVVAGDLSSAYAAQQMTSNIVVERKKDQQRIDGLYSGTVRTPLAAATGVRTVAAASGASAMPVGTKVRPLEKKGDEVKVRLMSGEETWVPADAL